MVDPERCRARVQEFLRLSALAQNIEIAERYKDLADAYSRLAEREEELSPEAEACLNDPEAIRAAVIAFLKSPQ